MTKGLTLKSKLKAVLIQFVATVSVLQIMTVVTPNAVYAEDLSEVLQGGGTTQQQGNQNNTDEGMVSGLFGNATSGTTDTLDGIKDIDLSTSDVPATNTINQAIVKIGGAITSVLSYVLVTGLTLRVVIDLIYISLSFFRAPLSNGYTGNPQSGVSRQPNAMGGMSGGFGGGYGGMSGGYGGMGGGYGGMSGGYGGMGGTQTAAANQSQGAFGKIQWVSNAALNAAAAESNVDASGKSKNPYVMYAKDMVVLLIAVPILLALAVSGTLVDVSFTIAEYIIGALTSWIG